MYKGRQKACGLTMALKEMWDLQCSNHDVEALMALAHPNVVQLIEYFMKGPNLVLMLEYLSTNLAQVIQESSEKPLHETKFKNWMLQILSRLWLVIGHQLFTGSWNLQIY
jgi:serine/threonine protein kinase